MLLIDTYLDKSEIHGVGVFAKENAKKGEKIKSKQTLRCYKNSFDLNKVEFIKYWRSIKKDVEKIGITIDLN